MKEIRHFAIDRADKVVSTAMKWFYWKTTKGDAGVKDAQAEKALVNLFIACRRLALQRDREKGRK